MPGYAEFLDVENGVKILTHLIPPDVQDSAGWQQVCDMAKKLDENAAALVAATAGRSQNPKAKELRAMTEELVRASSEVVESPESGLMSTIEGAVAALPNVLAQFDQERLQRS